MKGENKLENSETQYPEIWIFYLGMAVVRGCHAGIRMMCFGVRET